MHLVDLVPPPYARAAPCAGPCAWCGSDGSHALADGAALAREVTLDEGAALTRVGLWLALPEGERALRVLVSGGAVREGVVAPSAVRFHAADVSRAQDSPAWRGAPLAGAVVNGERALVADLRGLGARGEGLARVGVVEVAGLAGAAGEGELLARVIAGRGGCLAQRVRVRVRARAVDDGAVAGAYLAFAGDALAQCGRVGRWVDGVAGALAERGVWRGAVALRALADGRAAEGAVRVTGRGVDGAAWALALRWLARGRVESLALWDPRDPDAAGVEVAPATRARPAPCEASAWARGGNGALGEAWWRACEPGAPGTLQCVVGRWPDPVTPRVVTAWERARGMRAFNADEGWLGRFVRAPGELAWCRGARHEGAAVRACWPGPAGGVT